MDHSQIDNAAAIDLSDMATIDELDHEVLNPSTGASTGWIIRLGGPSHPRAMAFQEEAQRKALHRQRKIEQAQVNGRKFVSEEMTVDETRRQNVSWVVSRINGWSPAVKLKEISPDPIPYSEQAAFQILLHPKYGWILADLVEVLNADGSFIGRSAKV